MHRIGSRLHCCCFPFSLKELALPFVWVDLFAIERVKKNSRLNYTPNLVLHWKFKTENMYSKKNTKKFTKLFNKTRKKNVIAYNLVAKKHIISSQFNVRYIFISYSIKYFIHTNTHTYNPHSHTWIHYITPYTLTHTQIHIK